MSKLPNKIKNSLQEEAIQWDTAISKETPEQVQELLNDAETFTVPRPARQPVSLRMDPYDISMIKRIARKKGLPHTQLMAMWLRERVEKEKKRHTSE